MDERKIINMINLKLNDIIIELLTIIHHRNIIVSGRKKKLILEEYKTLTDVPIGTEMIINNTSKSVKLVEIRYFPTRYKCDDGNYYFTHEVEILWQEDVKPSVD